VAPFASLIQLAYAERTYHKQGSIIRIEPTEPLRVVRENDSQAPAASVIMRRIDAA
jgi:hypothetical protein